jgi:hypothetical protein
MPNKSDQRSENVSGKVTRETKERLESYCSAHDRTESWVVSRSLELFLSLPENSIEGGVMHRDDK